MITGSRRPSRNGEMTAESPDLMIVKRLLDPAKL